MPSASVHKSNSQQKQRETTTYVAKIDHTAYSENKNIGDIRGSRKESGSLSEKFKRSSLEKKSKPNTYKSNVENNSNYSRNEKFHEESLQINNLNFEIDENYGEVILRAKEIKSFGRNSQRGSSKALCSLMSVS